MFRKSNTKIHFVGIGGIGMSGIAEVLLNHGYIVSGSDIADTETTRRLAGLGAVIFQGHAPENVSRVDVVVTSSAVNAQNPEVQAARAQRIPVIPRAEMLAELIRLKDGVLIAGSHGKTTTTSLIAHTLHQAGRDPTVVIGGKVNAFGSNARLGYGQMLVAEADESDGSFLCLPPTHAVVTNIDQEHLDHYHTREKLMDAFVGFINRVPFYGAAVVCTDNLNVREILPRLQKRFVTYGTCPKERDQSEAAPLAETPDYEAYNIRSEGPVSVFSVRCKGEERGEFRIAMPGIHNVLNATATLAIADLHDVHPQRTREALASFSGVQRRFTIRAQTQGITVVDDYGHHPTEIRATLSGARRAYPKARIIAVAQPHRYTRLRDHFEDFATSFQDADVVMITEVYSARETPIEGYSGQSLCAAIAQHRDEVHFVGDLDQMKQRVLGMLQENDVLITLGAGSITHSSIAIAEALEARSS